MGPSGPQLQLLATSRVSVQGHCVGVVWCLLQLGVCPWAGPCLQRDAACCVVYLAYLNTHGPAGRGKCSDQFCHCEPPYFR